MGADDVTVTLFAPEEWRFYKSIRLKALLSDPGVFGSSHALEAFEPDAKWQKALVSPDIGVFGVFHFGDVIGMTGIVLDRNDRSTAKLWGSWLEPKWRDRGLSQKMYAARIDWARRHPDVQRIVVSHRESNTASKMANQKHGFAFTHKSEHVWRDGVTEPEVFYVLAVKDDTPQAEPAAQ